MALATLPLPGHGQESSRTGNSTSWTAVIETEVSAGIARHDLEKVETVFRPEFTTEVSLALRLTGIVRLRGDALDKLEPGRPDQDNRDPISRRVFLGDRADGELRPGIGNAC